MIAEQVYDLLPSEWPLYIGDLPATSTIAVGIMEYDGFTGTVYFGPVQQGSILDSIIKIVIRHTSYEVGRSWIEEAKSILRHYHDDTILGAFLVGSPMYLGRTPEKLHEFQVTFKIKVKE